MSQRFTEWIKRVIEERTPVTIGEGDALISGTITEFDEHHRVITYVMGQVSHYIPLTSIRSFGSEETASGLSCSLELFRR